MVLSAILDPLYYFLAGPHIPPGTMTDIAQGAQFDFNVLFVIALPVLLAVWIYLVYAIVMWRASRGGPEPVGGPAARGHFGIQVGWILTTTVIVLFLAGFGTYELVQPGGAGGGQGSSPIWTPTSKTILPIQVIGQQWKFTYRYPTFGGFETDQLVIPDDTTIEFNVTSLDVIHSFWAYQLGVKADANPDYNNVAYTTTRQLGSFIVRCAELCGIWHGAMYNIGRRGDAPAVRGMGEAHRGEAAPQHQVAASVRSHLHAGCQRGRRRLLPGQRRPVFQRGAIRRAAAEGRRVTWPSTRRSASSSTPVRKTSAPPRRNLPSGAAPCGCSPMSCGRWPGASSDTSSATGWATSSPAATPRSRTPARTTSPSCSASPWASPAGWPASAA